MYIQLGRNPRFFSVLQRRKRHINHNILWSEKDHLHIFCSYPTFKVLILFMPESTEGVDVGQVTALDYENEANRTEKWEKREEHWAD